jgi:hypothetical protein
MQKKLFPLPAVVVLLLVTASLAQAITFGQPDGDRHPNVGSMVFLENGVRYQWCSGTLISPTVFLTAAHCTAPLPYYDVDPHDIWVTFDPVLDENSTLLRGTYDLNPAAWHDMHDAVDIAVIILDEPVAGITPAQLPAAGLLDQMKADHSLRDQTFVAVGYGTVRDDKTGGPHAFVDNNERRFVEQEFLALKPGWIQFSMNPSTGNGGACYGDSGGPHFLGESDVIVALTVTGDAMCRATDTAYRLDIESARAYLSEFVTLP